MLLTGWRDDWSANHGTERTAIWPKQEVFNAIHVDFRAVASSSRDGSGLRRPLFANTMIGGTVMPGSRLIVVTGVSRGLGRALTEGFIKAGHVVAGCARSADAIADLESQFGLPHRFDAVDLANSGQVEKWSASILKELGPPDVLVNARR